MIGDQLELSNSVSNIAINEISSRNPVDNAGKNSMVSEIISVCYKKGVEINL